MANCFNETITDLIAMDLQDFVLNSGLLWEHDYLRSVVRSEEVAQRLFLISTSVWAVGLLICLLFADRLDVQGGKPSLDRTGILVTLSCLKILCQELRTN